MREDLLALQLPPVLKFQSQRRSGVVDVLQRATFVLVVKFASGRGANVVQGLEEEEKAKARVIPELL